MTSHPPSSPPGPRSLGAAPPSDRGPGPLPTEEQEQRALFNWVAIAQKQRPELRMLFAVPNGGHRHKAVAAKLKATGVRPGVPDLHLAVAREPYHGLWIEMKRFKGGQVSPDQKWWIDALLKEGYAVSLCRGWDAAKMVIEDYLAGRWVEVKR